MDGEQYSGILQENLLQSAEQKRKLGRHFTFQQDNGQKQGQKNAGVVKKKR